MTNQGLAAQSHIRVSHVGGGVKKLTAGEVSTVLFRVEHFGPDTVSVSHAISLPDGWTLIGRPAADRVAPGVAQHLLVAFRVSPRALPDTSLVAFHLLASDGDTTASAEARITVDAFRKLQVGVLSAPRAAPTQDEHTVRFAVTNVGNVRQAIDIRVRSSLGFEIRYAPQRVHLAPFSSEEVVVTVQPDARIDGLTRHALDLVATAEAQGEDRPTARAQSETAVLPRGRSFGSHGPSLPVRIGVLASGTGRAGASQFDLSVPEWRVAGGIATLAVRGPNAQAASAFTSQDFYQATYVRPGFSVHLGDQYVRQTELVTQGASGFGLHLAGTLGRLDASAYALRSRFGFPTWDSQGFSVATPLSNVLRATLNAAAEQYTSSSYAGTVRADWAPDQTASAHAEVGVGSTDGRKGQGFSAQARMGAPGRRINVRYDQGSLDFPGSFRGARQFSAAASLDATDFLSLDVSTMRMRRSYDFSSSAPRSFNQSRIGASATFLLPSEVRLHTSISGNARSNSSRAQGIERSELFAAGAASLSSGSVSASASMEAGSMGDHISDNPFRRVDLSLYMRYGSAFLSVTATWDFGARVFYPIHARRRQFGGNLDLKVGRNSSIDFQYYFNDISAAYPVRMHFGEAEIRYTLPFGHQVGVQGRLVTHQTDYRTTTDVVGGLSYNIPLDVPVGRPAPGVRGRVLMAKTGAPVRDVMVTLGEQTVLTDEKGRFYLAARQGTTPTVDAGLVDPGLVLLNPDALRVDEGGTPLLQLYLVPGATVSGSLHLEDGNNSNAVSDDVDQEDLHVHGITLSATNGSETRYAMTGVDGIFRFIGLTRGTWTLSPIVATLPAGVKPLATATPIEVEDGQPQSVLVPVARRSRAVRMVTSATLSLTSAAASTRNPQSVDSTPGSESHPATMAGALNLHAAPTSDESAPGVAAGPAAHILVPTWGSTGETPLPAPVLTREVPADPTTGSPAQTTAPDMDPWSRTPARAGAATTERPMDRALILLYVLAAILSLLQVARLLAVWRRLKTLRHLHPDRRRSSRLRLVESQRRAGRSDRPNDDHPGGVRPAARITSRVRVPPPSAAMLQDEHDRYREQRHGG